MRAENFCSQRSKLRGFSALQEEEEIEECQKDTDHKCIRKGFRFLGRRRLTRSGATYAGCALRVSTSGRGKPPTRPLMSLRAFFREAVMCCKARAGFRPQDAPMGDHNGEQRARMATAVVANAVEAEADLIEADLPRAKTPPRGVTLPKEPKPERFFLGPLTDTAVKLDAAICAAGRSQTATIDS